MGRGHKRRASDDGENLMDLPSEHLTIRHQVVDNSKRLIVILENAQLETIKNGNRYELLNPDDHINFLKKSGRSLGSCRPDIVHQCLLMLFDSILNRTGFLQVYIRTEKNVLIEIHPQTRIPRTFKRFSGLMVQLLHKYSVRGDDTSQKLMKVIKNPIIDHLPVGCKKYCLSYNAKKKISAEEIVPDEGPVVVVIGAIAHGEIKPDYVEETVSIQDFPLSAALTCAYLCIGSEKKWKVC